MLGKELRKLYSEKKYDDCRAYAEEWIKRDPSRAIAFRYRFLCMFALGEKKESLPAAQEAIRLSSPKINGDLWRRAVKALKSEKKSVDRKAFWAGCNSIYEIAFHQSKVALLSGEVDDAIAALKNIESRVFPEEIVAKLRGCIALLGGRSPSGFHVSHAVEGNEDQVRMILVAGMGWSGSGAIFDYLAEFDDVQAVGGESPYISRGDYSLRSIAGAIGDMSQLREQLINFFYLNIAGFGKIANGNDLKTFGHARRRSLGEHQNRHFEAAIKFCVTSRAMIRCVDQLELRRLFSALVKLVVREFSSPVELPPGQIVLMDNVVPIRHVGATTFLENTDVYCCFRDPRSNYVDLKREDRKFDQSVASYIRDQGATLKNLNDLVKGAAERTASYRVHRVQFEEFIFSESRRDSIALSLGLDMQRRAKHGRLKPWESMRNVVLHQEHPDQDEIRMIEESLAEFCYEPYVRPLLGSALS